MIETYSEPAIAVLGLDNVEVAEPVAVPSPESSGVVHANSINTKSRTNQVSENPPSNNITGRDNKPLDLKPSPLKRTSVIPQRRRSIRTTENVLVQVNSPNEILVLPRLAQARQLHVHSAVVLEHIVALAEESREFLDADVLAHLELGDLVEFLGGDVAVVHAQDVALLGGDASGAEGVGGVSGTLLGDGDTGDFGAVVETGEFGESAPAAADVEHGLAFFKSELFADDGHLVVLEFFESFFAGGVGDHAAGVDHARAKEPAVVVVAGVVVGADLLHVLFTGVQEDVTSESAEQEFHERPGQLEVGPVVAVLEDIEQVAVDIDFAVDVHFREVLERDLGAAVVLTPQRIGLESEVRLDGATRELGLVVNARAEAGSPGPDDDQDGEEEQDSEEGHGLPAAANVPSEEHWHTEQAEQSIVVEALVAWAFSRERSIADGRELRLMLALRSQWWDPSFGEAQLSKNIRW
jgi:hypothetical protein